MDVHPGAAALLRYFEYHHLPDYLQDVSQPFAALAERMVGTLPGGPEVTTGLRKLLEAKDCAVRAALRDPAPLVEELAHDRPAQLLHITARIPDGLPPEKVAGFIGEQVAEQLRQRSAPERSAPRRVRDDPQA